jgi:hypothetical protein
MLDMWDQESCIGTLKIIAEYGIWLHIQFKFSQWRREKLGILSYIGKWMVKKGFHT